MNDWWLQAAYLGFRLPVIVNSSPGTVGPQQNFGSTDITHEFITRLTFAVYNYDKMVKSGKMKQEMIRDSPLDMQPYGMLLGSCRRPNPKIDKFLHTDHSDHIIVICNNNFFKLPLSGCDEQQILACINSIAERSKSPGIPVGILTANDRDTWAEDFAKLQSYTANKKIIADIESSLFVLCIDKELPAQEFAMKNRESVRAVQSMTGYSFATNSANRWHDKTVQFIVSYDGFVGCQYEHSPCEGGPLATLHDFALSYAETKINERITPSQNFSEAENLTFRTDKTTEMAIEKAKNVVERISRNIDMECFMFEAFGANTIKKCKLSPDSFIQMAMQLTYYKVHGRPPAHYESAALRRFKSARTECIRSTCNEFVEFAKTMIDDNSSVKLKKEALIKAINAHKKIAGDAATGEGVDRLFFGLKMIAKDEGIELPKFFNDVGYTRSTYFTLTSSQVPYKTPSFMCYGPVVPDGYGCCYNPRPNDMFFACSSFKECSETDTKAFAETLKQSLKNMRTVAES